MKKVALAAALSVAATSAFAAGPRGGKLSDPVIEPPVIAQETGTSGGFVVPLILLILVAAAVAASS
jgi:hypothetical protein